MLDWIEIGRYLEDQISSAVQRIPPDHPEIGNEHNFKAQGWIHFKVCKLQTISLKGRFPRILGVHCSNCGWFFCSIIEFRFCREICGENQNQDFMKGLWLRSFTNFPHKKSRFSLPSVKIWQQCQTWGVETLSQMDIDDANKDTKDKLGVKNLFISCSSKLLQK